MSFLTVALVVVCYRCRWTSPAFPPQAFSAAGITAKHAEQRLDGTQLVISDAQTGLKGASKRIAMLFMDA
jgi:hypothetical protein